ncbi:MAG: hypothetical protein ACI4LI_00305 [Candidatus Fimenecus sp.]
MDKEEKKTEQGKCTETETGVENAEKPMAETTTEKGEKTPAQPTETATEQETDEAENGEQAKADGENDSPSSQAAEQKSEKTDADPEEEKTETAATESSAEQSATSSENTELLQAKAQIAAYKSGVRPDAVEDAVVLAMHDAAKENAVDEAGLQKALKGVLSRHPEWKAGGTATETAGFRIGADSTAGATQNNDAIAKAFGNL